MRGTGEMLQYIMRDETLHASFGIRTVRQIMAEEQISINDIEKDVIDMFVEAGEYENNYAKFLLPNPIVGYSSDDHINQYKFVANRRAVQLGLKTVPFPGAKNALPWLDEQANVRKEKNFFETRVTEYQTGGGLDWGD
jgi:ribonucleoside-diphosphate reductase beta chain